MVWSYFKTQGSYQPEESGNSVGGRGKIACIIRLSNCCCNIVSDCIMTYFGLFDGIFITYFVVLKLSVCKS